jgi:hypothetical protein
MSDLLGRFTSLTGPAYVPSVQPSRRATPNTQPPPRSLPPSYLDHPIDNHPRQGAP